MVRFKVFQKLNYVENASSTVLMVNYPDYPPSTFQAQQFSQCSDRQTDFLFSSPSPDRLRARLANQIMGAQLARESSRSPICTSFWVYANVKPYCHSLTHLYGLQLSYILPSSGSPD